MRYAGLDFSICAPGIAKYDTDTGKLSAEVVSTSRFGKNYKTRNKFLITYFLDELRECDILFIENYAFAGCGRITDIAEVLGAIKYQLPETCKIHLVSPNTLKKAVTGRGDASKEKVIEKINSMGIPVKDDNVADAVGLLLMGMGALEGKVREWNPEN